VISILTGKTNGDKTLFGRALRHQDFTKCILGALGFYLLARFDQTREFDSMDFTDNKKWFDIKLLVDCKSSKLEDLFKSVEVKTYTDIIKKICKKLGIPSSHWLHYGRHNGTIQLEFEEVDTDQIKNLGNWNPDVYDSRYRSPFPFKGMRVKGGYASERGSHFQPRGQFEEDDLYPKLEPQLFEFVEGALEKLDAFEDNSSNRIMKVTARSFLRMLQNLRRVILQDAALMMHAGRQHHIFNKPVFQSAAFKEFQQKLVRYALLSLLFVLIPCLILTMLLTLLC
jgi:hypothetical protein